MKKKKRVLLFATGVLITAFLALMFGRWLGSTLLQRRQAQHVEAQPAQEELIEGEREEEWPTIAEIEEEEPPADRTESPPEEPLPTRGMAEPEETPEPIPPLVEVKVRTRKTEPARTGASPTPPTPPEPPQKPRQEEKPAAAAPRYTVQVGTYRSEENAKAFSQELQGLGYAPRVRSVVKKEGTLYYVYLGAFEDKRQAQALRDELKRLEYEAFVTEQP